MSQPQKRRRGRGRFADIKVGDQLQQRSIGRWDTMLHDERAANDAGWQRHERDYGYIYAQVTDLWFDPVAGEDDPIRGEMVGIVHLHQGQPRGGKRAHTIRGLASNGWQYAERDEIEHWQQVREGVRDGTVVGIGAGRRGRPQVHQRLL